MINIKKYLTIYKSKIKVKTSSIQLNEALDGGFKANQIYHIWGPPSSYKTSTLLSISENTENFILYLNFDRNCITHRYNNLIIINPNSAKEAIEVLDELPDIKVDAIIIDSLPSILIEQAIDTQRFASNTIKAFIGRLLSYLSKFNNPAIILLNQIRTDIFNVTQRTSYYGKSILHYYYEISILFMLGLNRKDYVIINFKIDDSTDNKKYKSKLLLYKTGKLSKGYSAYLYCIEHNLPCDKSISYLENENNFQAFLKQNSIAF